jgi:enamine deaminase RidA (YjgF/YER057c/UK114 family)
MAEIKRSDPATLSAPATKAQVEQVFRNLEAALTAAGATFADVVKMNIAAR